MLLVQLQPEKSAISAATTSFCRPAGHVICGSNAKANTRVTFRAEGPIQQLTCVSRVRPPNGQLIPFAVRLTDQDF